MKVTPLEIRQKSFEKKLRGYDKDEVNAFLLSLSQEWERVLDDSKELKIKLETSEREVQKLREVENSLFKTLKTAEDTGANVVEQARKTAELHMRETQWKAEALINESKNNAKTIIEEAEGKSKVAITDMEEELKIIQKQYKELQKMKQLLVSNLKSLASDTLQNVEDMISESKKFNIDQEIDHIKKEVRSTTKSISNSIPTVNSDSQSEKDDSVEKSFFDQID